MSTQISSFPTGGLAVYRFFEVENLGDQAPLEGNYVNGEDTSHTQTCILTPPSAALPGGALLPGNLVQVDAASANVINPNVKAVQAPTHNTLPAGLELGIVFGAPWLRYKPTDNALYAGTLISVLRGFFVARMDLNSFVVGQDPHNIGDNIYMAIQDGGVATKNLGLFSTTASGTAANPALVLGQVVGFDTVTSYGSPVGAVVGGPTQISGAYSSPSSASLVVTGGATLVRVQFNLNGIGVA